MQLSVIVEFIISHVLFEFSQLSTLHKINSLNSSGKVISPEKFSLGNIGMLVERA